MNAFTIESVAGFALQGLWRATWQAGIIAMIVLFLQALLGKHLGARGKYALWAIVVVRLMLPVLPESKFSLFNSPFRGPVAAAPGELLAGVDATPVSQTDMSAGTIATAPKVQSHRWRPTWTQVVAGAWLLGAIVLATQVAAAWWKLRKLCRQLTPITDSHILRLIGDCESALNLRHRPRVLCGDAVRTPAVAGVWRPVLLLPARVLETCQPHELRHIVMHELAHLKRHDVAGNWLIAGMTVIHWFNPLVWLMAARMRADRELACDELVLATAGQNESHAYGSTLLKLIEILSPQPMQRQTVGILESSGSMQRRVRMIAQFDSRSSRRWMLTPALLVVLGLTALTDRVSSQATRPTQTGAQGVPFRGSIEPLTFAPAPADVELYAKLRRVLPELKFDGVPFADVIEFLRDVSGANLFVEWRALETAGIDRKSPVTLRLRDVPFSAALERVLRDVGGGAVRLDYVVEQNTITISTDEQLAGLSRTVLYDVSDLLGGDDPAALSKVITNSIAPDSWRDKGGGVGRIESFNKKLIITTTPKLHGQIALMLARLREKPTTYPRPLEE